MTAYASVARRPDTNSCFCHFARNAQFNRTGYHWIVAGLRRELFLEGSTSDHDPLRSQFEHTHPVAARFAIGRAAVLARPKWLYQLLARLTTAEKVWHWIGSTYMANVFERFWFDLFDPELRVENANVTAPMSAQQLSTACQHQVAGADQNPLAWLWEFQTACEASALSEFHAMVACTQLVNRCPVVHPLPRVACTLCKW